MLNHQYLNGRRFLPRAAKTIQKHKKQSSVKQASVKVVDIRKNRTFLQYPRHSVTSSKTKSYLSEEDLIERQLKIYRANLVEINRKILTANAFWKHLDLVK